MKICCISDIHGHVIPIEPCDLLIIAGDICGHKAERIFGTDRFGYRPGSFTDQSYQAGWLNGEFKKWLNEVPAKDVVVIPGNHDFVFQHKHLIPTGLRWHLLIDEVKVIQGKKIYGSPYQHYFGGWAFNAPPKDQGGEEFLERKFSMIPDDTDIIIVHGPPYSYGDLVPNETGGELTGSTSLANRIMTIKPDLSVHGHIHMGYGWWNLPRDGKPDTIVVNASICDEQNQPKNNPLYFEI